MASAAPERPAAQRAASPRRRSSSWRSRVSDRISRSCCSSSESTACSSERPTQRASRRCAARLTPRQYQGLPLTPRDPTCPSTQPAAPGAAKLPLHELSPRLQPLSPRRTTPRPQSALHSPRFAASHPSITKAASRYRPASARPVTAAPRAPPRDRSPPPRRGRRSTSAASPPRWSRCRRVRGSCRPSSARRATPTRRVGSAPTARDATAGGGAAAVGRRRRRRPSRRQRRRRAEDAAADAPTAELDLWRCCAPSTCCAARTRRRCCNCCNSGRCGGTGGTRWWRVRAAMSTALRSSSPARCCGRRRWVSRTARPNCARRRRSRGTRRRLQCAARASYQAAEDAVVLVAGKGAERPRARRRAPRAQRRLVRAPSPLKAFERSSPPRSTSLRLLLAVLPRRGRRRLPGGRPADLFLVAEGSVAVLPADAVPPDDDDGGGGCRGGGPTSADSGRGRRFSLRRTCGATEVVAADGAETPWLGGTAAAVGERDGAAARDGRVALRRRNLSLAAADADAVFQIAPQLLAEWQGRRSAPPGATAPQRRGGAGGRDRGEQPRARRGGVAWWRSCARRSASLLRPRGRR